MLTGMRESGAASQATAAKRSRPWCAPLVDDLPGRGRPHLYERRPATRRTSANQCDAPQVRPTWLWSRELARALDKKYCSPVVCLR